MNLKPCPFCGGEAAYVHQEYDYTNKEQIDKHWVGCDNGENCPCVCYTGLFDTKEEAIKLWNTRYFKTYKGI